MRNAPWLLLVLWLLRGSDSYCLVFQIRVHHPRRHVNNRIRLYSNEVTTEAATTERDALLSSLPPPPDPTANPDDDAFRSLRDTLPLSFQHWMRDSGFLRGLVDGLTYLGLPNVVRDYPQALGDFVYLSTHPKHSFQTLSYGAHPLQTLDLFQPDDSTLSRGIIVFCHGGAWGSGRPWMYRLTATPFLEKGYTVAIWGYRTYPDTNVDGQVDDLRAALDTLRNLYPTLPTTLIGHSSGSHVSVLGVMQEKLGRVDNIVPMAGIYDIPAHYSFERGRGVNQISALKPACGHVTEEWQKRSPTFVAKTKPPSLPNMLIVHGAKDSVVPYTSAVEFYNALPEVDTTTLSILQNVEHAETVLQLMLGGETQDVILEWVEQQHTRHNAE